MTETYEASTEVWNWGGLYSKVLREHQHCSLTFSRPGVTFIANTLDSVPNSPGSGDPGICCQLDNHYNCIPIPLLKFMNFIIYH